ncbi:LysR family transcriptional regulator [Ferrimonas marina]|uniref:DNA-binding transcriptional regulator, LysR family n=1 Tax=Ferrimonas marina TaxID=299255 RepID=A0A1M5Z950_9GAMM|nr:LysR family transcriptional regulator [Ferrimonas marina]SHI20750.1 DNA-binding transcriptional regulator, LysR family [Ferrimonas marina]
MAKDRFSNLDLNLLRTFQILAQEGNMRRAASRLHVTQPAVSHALQRLRHHFDDPLFTKTRQGLALTEFGQQLNERLRPAMDDLVVAVNQVEGFDPAELTGKLRIALAPHIAQFFATRLFKLFQQQAPNASVDLISWSRSTQSELLNGETLLGVNYPIQGVSKELIQLPLAMDRGGLLARRDHPFDGDIITPEQMTRYELVSLLNPDRNDHLSDAERVMAAYGQEVKVRFRTDSALGALDIVRHSDLMLPFSTYFLPSALQELRVIQVDVEEHHLEYPLIAYYRQGQARSAATLWLCQMMAEQLRQQMTRVRQ